MATVVRSFAIQGIDGYPVDIEVKMLEGQPVISIIGLGDQAVKEAAERIQAAIDESGYVFPKKRGIISLAPRQDIYDFLYPYFNSDILDEADGGYIGTIEDEDGTYRKEFYANYERFNKIIENREYLCKGCYKKMDGSLCNDWKYCKRAYDIGRGDTIEDS